MPIYNYICRSCQYSIEKFANLSDIDKVTQEPCPRCRENEMVLTFVPTFRRKPPVRMGNLKPPSDFAEKLKAIKDAHKGSTINPRL